MNIKFNQFSLTTLLSGRTIVPKQVESNQLAISPNDEDTLKIIASVSLNNYNDTYRTKIAVAAYVDGLSIFDEGVLLPKNNLTLFNTHGTKLVSSLGGSLEIKNWITKDGSNPELKFTTNGVSMIKNYVEGVDKTETNTIRVFVWKSLKPEMQATIKSFDTKGTRGMSMNAGMGAGEDTNQKYSSTNFHNPIYLGMVTIFYNISEGLPKFNPDMFNDSIFRTIPKV
ncbi:MAG TPA: hypothetical protein PKD00_01595 [Burkholderiales bacterium]|nr:hypothetical protein [Burkholderiales bacterium]